MNYQHLDPFLRINFYFRDGLLSQAEYDRLLSKYRLARINEIVEGIHQMITRPGSTPLTSRQMKQREEQRRNIATGLKLTGRKVRREYE